VPAGGGSSVEPGGGANVGPGGGAAVGLQRPGGGATAVAAEPGGGAAVETGRGGAAVETGRGGAAVEPGGGAAVEPGGRWRRCSAADAAAIVPEPPPNSGPAPPKHGRLHDSDGATGPRGSDGDSATQTGPGLLLGPQSASYRGWVWLEGMGRMQRHCRPARTMTISLVAPGPWLPFPEPPCHLPE
jgi:hypothetical protein